MKKTRHMRVETPAIEVRLAAEQGRLMNISATGALVYTTTALLVGRERPLTLKVSDEVVIPLKVKIVRVELLPPSAKAAAGNTQGKTYGVAVTFAADLTDTARQAVEDLCGPAFTNEE